MCGERRILTDNLPTAGTSHIPGGASGHQHASMRRSCLQWIVFGSVLLTAVSASAQRDLTDIPVPDPELERQTFQLPEGFEVNLFAADPAIAKPIQMNFDVDGRLWLVSSEVYPQIEPGQVANDRVLVLNDSDGDGVSDETHVFADGLLIPTGIAPGDGGAYVANSTELLHFSDTDGDLRADERRVVLSGFGTEDTHHILHTLRWGIDGSLYFNQSIYIHSHIETPWGVRRLNAGGIWQFRPETYELGVFMRGLVNSWGHDFDRFGQSFATDGAGGEGINYVIPGGYYFTAANASRIMHGLNPGSPKHCGLEIVESPQLPDDWQGDAITNDFRGHRVCRFRLSDDGAGYVSREQQEVIRSDHVAFRPVDVKQGPDGAIYIADWYNPIIQHGEVDFRDDRRDHTHGRIWRVSWKGGDGGKAPRVSQQTNPELFELLRSPDRFRRRAAKLTLRERGPAVATELLTWLDAADPDDDLRLEALWCLQNLRVQDDALLEQLLQSSRPEIRAAATRVLTQWQYQVPDSVNRLSSLVGDEHARVRLEAVRGLSFSALRDSQRKAALLDQSLTPSQVADHDSPQRVEAALRALNHPVDQFLDYGLWLTVRELADQWIPAFEAGDVTFNGEIDQIVFAFRAAGGIAPTALLLPQVYAADTDPDERSKLTELIAAGADPGQLGLLYEMAVEHEDVESLSIVEASSVTRKVVPKVSAAVFPPLFESQSPDLRTIGLRTAGRWKIEGLQSGLIDIVQDASAPITDRIAAAEGVIIGRQKKLVDSVVKTIRDDAAPTELRTAVLTALVTTQPARTAKLFGELLPSFATTPELAGRVTESLLQQKDGIRLLTETLGVADVPVGVGREMLRILRQSGRALPELEAAIRASGNLPARKTLSATEREQLLAVAMKQSSPELGETVFRNEQLGCLKCHAVGGAGGKVGPDMISLGGSAQPDYLLDSLLNPNAKIKENYHTVIIATRSGQVYSGIQIGQSQEAVTIRNAEDVELQVRRNEIEEIVPGVSLMPEGLVDTLTDEELAAMVRFLSELGRTPEYTLSRRRLARTWEVMLPTESAAYRLRRTSYAMAATDDPAFEWKSVISKVNGSLPLDAIPEVSVRNRSAAGSRGIGFARTYVDVTQDGPISFRLNDAEGLEIRIDDLPVAPAAEISLPLQRGRHRVTLTVDRAVRSQPIELELVESSGNAEVVN